MDSCTPTAEVASRQHLRAASQRKLIVPRYRLNSFGRRCFAVAGVSTWNSLPDSLRDRALSLNIFRCQLKTHLFVKYWRDVLSALEIFLRMRYISLRFTYLLTNKYNSTYSTGTITSQCHSAPQITVISLELCLSSGWSSCFFTRNHSNCGIL